MQKNTPSSQVHMDIIQDTPSWVTNQASVNLRKSKSYKHLLWPQCYETRHQLQEKNCKKYKHMEIKQHISKWPTGYWRNPKGNKKFLETNDSENMTTQNLWDAPKAVLRGTFIMIQSYLKKQEKHQIDNLTLHLKQLEKEQKPPQN